MKSLEKIKHKLKQEKSLREVSRRIGVNVSTLSRLLKNDDCKLSTYVKLEEYYGGEKQ